MDVSVVIPTYRNAAVLPELTRRLVETLSSLNTSFEIILIDDGNKDHTWSVISELATQYPALRGIRLSRNFGQHPAIGAGYRAAQGQRIVLMDADLEDRPEALPEVLAKLDGSTDIVFTTIANPYQHAKRRWTSSLFREVFTRLSPVQWPNNLGTLRAFTRQVLDAMLEYEEYNILYGPLMFYLGFRCSFITVVRGASASGSSYTFFKRFRLAASTLVSYTNLPNNLFLTGGAVVLGMVFLYILALVGQYVFFSRTAPPGLTLLALLISASLAANLIAFGVLGNYVYRVYQEVLRRPRYHVMDQVEGTTAKGQERSALVGEQREYENHRSG